MRPPKFTFYFTLLLLFNFSVVLAFQNSETSNKSDVVENQNFYLPMQSGNQWNYKNKSDQSGHIFFRAGQLRIGRTIPVKGQEYHKSDLLLLPVPNMDIAKKMPEKVSVTKNFRAVSYIKKDGHHYKSNALYVYNYQLNNPLFPTPISFNLNINYSEFTFLKTNIPTGESWNSKVKIQSKVEAQNAPKQMNFQKLDTTLICDINFTVLEKGVTETINETHFKDVIKIKSESMHGTMEIWYAKGIGVIFQKGKMKVGEKQKAVFKQELMSYTF